MTTGQKIRRARKRAGLVQLDVQALTGIRQATLSAYERDKVEPRQAALRSIAYACGCEVAELLGDGL